jgi:hypothetical protein
MKSRCQYNNEAVVVSLPQTENRRRFNGTADKSARFGVGYLGFPEH